MSDYFDIRERLRARYIAPVKAAPKAEVIGGDGFVTEVAGRVLLTAPASTFTEAGVLPKELADRWEKAAQGNQHYMWLQGRFVEAEKANRNGAFWSTEDLQFGEMSVRHGPLNWLHEESTIVGTIADNALIRPQAVQAEFHHQQMANLGYTYNGPADTYTHTDGTVLDAEQLVRTAANMLSVPQPRPYIAAVSAVWKWVHPDKAYAVEAASNEGRLFYSMECIAQQMACVSDGGHQGCGQSFDYIQAMTQPQTTCEHIASRSSARRMVNPSFLGGAILVPPTQPGWGNAHVEVMKQAASLAQQTERASQGMGEEQWTALMAQVLRFATA